MSLNNFFPEHNYVCYFSAFPQIKFTSKTGGELQREVGQQHSGGMEPPENIKGPQTVGQVTLTKPYDPILDATFEALVTRALNGVVDVDQDLICQPVDSRGIPNGKADTYKDCTFVSLRKPDVNKGSSEAAMLELIVQPRFMI